mmetsp:Transcript_32668/g.53107  ORF Transcript_32668/g.53107 Transcript_32668/m.53107 type:complete len:356 (+) Transcript_32668:23-1090(+)|eukprot:jgi/Bigna1/86274/estExt_fgenesh1_pg.C_90166
MPKQKKRKGGNGDKKKKDFPKNVTSAPNQSTSQKKTPAEGTDFVAVASVDKMGNIDGPWIKEIREIEQDTKHKFGERGTAIAATNPPFANNADKLAHQHPPNAAVSNIKLMDRKLVKPAPRRRPRKLTISDQFVGASLGGNLRRLIHLRRKVAIDCTNRKWGWTALMAASGNGHLNCVRYLLTCTACINIQEKRSGWTALMLAARSMNLDIVEYLIRHGADIKARSSNHQTVYGLGDRVLVGKAIQRGLEARSKMNKRIKKEEEQHHARGEEQGEGKGQATNSRKPLLQWNEDDVRLWLKAVGCSKVEKAFEENMVDGEWLLDMNEQALDELGIGDEKVRSKLKLEISRLILGPD